MIPELQLGSTWREDRIILLGGGQARGLMEAAFACV